MLSEGGAVEQHSCLVDVLGNRAGGVNVDGDGIGAVGEVGRKEGEVAKGELVVCPLLHRVGGVYCRLVRVHVELAARAGGV